MLKDHACSEGAGSIAKGRTSYEPHWAHTQPDTTEVSPQAFGLWSQWALGNWSGSKLKKWQCWQRN